MMQRNQKLVQKTAFVSRQSSNRRGSEQSPQEEEAGAED